MSNLNDSKIIQISAASLLLSVAEADEILDAKELLIILDILQDFFSINSDDAKLIMNKAKLELKKSTGLFEFGSQINKVFSNDDKLDFINCIFEVAFADGDLHYLEHHTVKKIANILNIEKEDIILAKTEAKNYLD
tara:strand:- start:689 stop:1096 length:408 start_codon:yes stop_codon:yes gene_type:complete